MKQPFVIKFNKIGNSHSGYISVVEAQKNISFEIKRVFFTYHTPEEVIRGHHAHHYTEMVLIAVAGKIILNTEMPDGSKCTFVLDKPEYGVYLPRYCWHTMQYSHNAVQLVLASTLYQEEDYIRAYDDVKNVVVQ